MKFAKLSCIASKKQVDMEPVLFKDLWHQVLMESVKLSPALLFDRPRLRTACAMLAAKVGNKDLDLVTRRRIQGMMGLLNLYLNEGLNLSWRKTSVVVSKTQGYGDTHAQWIREWTLQFLQTNMLPFHRLGHGRWTVLHDEDIASKIKLKVLEKSKKGFVKAEDIVNLVASPEMQKTFSEKGLCKTSISNRTAAR